MCIRDGLEALAQSTGRSRSCLAADAIREYLDANEWQVAGVRAAMRSIDEKGAVPHGDVKAWVESWGGKRETAPVSYTHLRAHETVLDIVCRLLLEKKYFDIIHLDLSHVLSSAI